VRAGLDVNADDRFAQMAKRVKAAVAQFQAELIFAPGAEAAMAFVASGVLRALMPFLDVNFGMDFKSDHDNSPTYA
jgi:hypothetical protein